MAMSDFSSSTITIDAPISEVGALIDARGVERVPLQVQDLPVGVGRDPHVAD